MFGAQNSCGSPAGGGKADRDERPTPTLSPAGGDDAVCIVGMHRSGTSLNRQFT